MDYTAPYGDLTALNTCRDLMDAVGREILLKIVQGHLNLLGTSAAVYEVNGDYATALFTSDYCRFLDCASRRLCGTEDNAVALASGKWHCHESCWTQASKVSVETGRPFDLRPCLGGINIYAVPIISKGRVIGTLSFGYGTPPRDEKTLREIARRYQVDVEELRRVAERNEPRPDFITEVAKQQIETAAELVAGIYDRRQAEETLKRLSHQHQLILDSVAEGIYGVDPQGNTIFVNPAAVNMTGYAAGELIGRCQHDILHHTKPDGSPYPREECKIYAAFKDGAVHHVADEVFWRKDGTSFPVEYVSTPIREQGELVGAVVVFKDITERKRAEDALRKSEERYRQLVENSPLGILVCDTEGNIKNANHALLRILGSPSAEATMSINVLTFPPLMEAGGSANIRKCLETGELVVAEHPYKTKWGNTISVRLHLIPLKDTAGKINGVQAIVEDFSEYKQAEKALRESEEKYRAIFETTGTATVIIEEDGTISLANTESERLSGYSKEELEGKKSWTEFVMKDYLERLEEYRRIRKADPNAAPRNYEFRYIDRQGNVRDVLASVGMIPGIKKSVISLLDITDRKRAEDRIHQLYTENQRQLKTISALYNSALKLGQSLNLQELADDVARTCVEAFGASLAWLGRAEEDGQVRLLAHFPPESEYPRKIAVRWDDLPLGQGPTGRAIRSGSPVIATDVAGDSIFEPLRALVLAEGFCTSAAFPLISRDRPFGALNLYSDQPGFFTPERVEFFQAYAHQAAAALENARLFEEAGRRFEHLQALRNIDMAITASLDLRVTFNIVLDQVTAQLGIHAADILLLNQHTQILQYAAGRGFRTKAIERSSLRLGEGYAGRAALGRIVNTTNLYENGDDFARAPLLAGEDFISYYAVPLIAKGQVKGVLEIFHRAPLDPDPEWLYFLETLAGQAAIAIDNADLFEGMQRSNVELTLAYDATIEGWSRALDLRDKETEGHSQRVTEMTLRLARAMGMSEAELVHVRRGALLHDIGKLGIQDDILLKPGPLTDEEWEIMRLHPVYAFEMLSPIAYLRPALDIPYCHHEKWDGTGYPRGLKGEQIPLTARIFAVVDVWDALRSDRPYRPAWPEEKVREHIGEQAGKHFDPKVVELFLGE